MSLNYLDWANNTIGSAKQNRYRIDSK